MNWKKILSLILLVVGALWYRQYVLSNQDAAPIPAVEVTTQETVKSVAAEYSFSVQYDGQPAQELLEANAEVEYQDYGDAGKFVTSIDDIAADEGHYWAFYVNGEYSQTGISQTILNEGDIITFTYEAIDPTQL